MSSQATKPDQTIDKEVLFITASLESDQRNDFIISPLLYRPF